MTDPGPRFAWNTWDPRHPAAMVHLVSGITLRLCAYSAKSNTATEVPFDPSVRLGPRQIDGSYAELELTHAGSRVLVRFAKPPDRPDVLIGEVQPAYLDEWGLRFWLLLDVGAAGANAALAGAADPYVDPPAALVTAGDTVVAFTTASLPVAAHRSRDPDQALRDIEAEGYYSRPAPVRGRAGWVQFRFAATEPRVVFVAAAGGTADQAITDARAALAAADATFGERAAATAGSRDRASARRDAVRDVVGWNTSWDGANRRMYTVATRSWAPAKFGGWFVWLSDAFYAAILAAHVGDAGVARANLDAALSNATAQGNLAGLTSGRTTWIDRSQLPIGAHATWLVHRLTGEGDVLASSYPVLRGAFDWWFEHRDGNHNGLLEPGSSPVGDGHFVHTKQAALDEAAMDNAPIYDEATFDPASHTLDIEDVALNSLLVLEAQTLAAIAAGLGNHEDGQALLQRAAGLAALVRDRLWDPGRRIFANRLWSGRFAGSVSPTSFYPLTAGIATRDQANALVRGHLADPWKFGGQYPVAGTPFDDPAAADNVYWRGRTWPTMNYLVWLGLVRYGYAREAHDLAERGWRMFAHGWAERRCWENYNQRTGEGGDSPDSDPFYTWGALLAMTGDERVAEAFTASVTGDVSQRSSGT